MANLAGRTKFTKGEWSIGKHIIGGNEIAVFGPEELSGVKYLGVANAFGDSEEETLANGKLIAAAPKMFWELGDILLALENGGLRKPKQWEASIRQLLESIVD